MWRQANLKAIIDHQPPWLVWLQCARCNWLGTAIRSFNRKYTLSLSISFKKWQHWAKTELPEATVPYKKWNSLRVIVQMLIPTIKLQDFTLSYIDKVALQFTSRHLLQFTWLPADCWKSASKETQTTLPLRERVVSAQEKKSLMQSKHSHYLEFMPAVHGGPAVPNFQV